MGTWIALWIVGIVIGVVLFKLEGPKIAGTRPRAQGWRTGTLVFGFIPLYGLNIFMSVVSFALYKLATMGKMQSQSTLNSKLSQTSLGVSTPPKRDDNPGSNSSNPFL